MAASIVVLLVYLVVVQSVSLFGQMTPYDFYQYWGVPAARRLSTEELGTPYREGGRYGAVLLDAAGRSRQPKFERVSRVSPRLMTTGTPFAYTLFALLPANYTQATSLYFTLQILFFLVAVGTLGVVYRYPLLPLLCLAFLLVLGSGSLNADLRLGNLGCFQLVSLAVLLAVADRLRYGSPSVALGGLLLSGLTLVAAVKPNAALVFIPLALHLWVAYGTRFLAAAALPAALVGGAAVVLSCLYFGSWTVWPEWYKVVFGPNPGAVGRPFDYTWGNYSTPRLLGFWLDLRLWTSAGLLAAGLAVSTAVVVARSVLADASARAAPLRGALARLLNDPHVAMAIGVTLTIALPPLVWYHYYVIALIPSLWLLSEWSPLLSMRLCGLVALVLSAGLPSSLFLMLGWNAAGHAAAALSWVALWCGLLLRLSKRQGPVAQSEVEHRGARRTSAVGGRHRRGSRTGRSR
jgi:hypothetical protein